MKNLLLSITFLMCVNGTCKVFNCGETEYQFIAGWHQICRQEQQKSNKECNKKTWGDVNLMSAENKTDGMIRLYNWKKK